MASEAFVRVVADTSDVDRQLTQGMDRAIRDVERALPEIDVDAQIDPDAITRMTRDLRRDIRDISAAADDIDVNVGLDPASVSRARAEVDDLATRLGDIDVDLHPEIDPASLARARAQVRTLQNDLATLDDRDLTVNVRVDDDDLTQARNNLRSAGDDAEDTDFDLSRLATNAVRGFGSMLGAVAKFGVGGTVAIAGVTSSLGGLVNIVAAAGKTFGGLDGIINQLAGAGAVYAASNAVLKISLIGVSDALSASFGSAEDFNEALQKLSPEAQRVFTVFRDSVPVFKSFQQALQDALFKQIESGTIAKFADSVKAIQPAAIGVAEAFGGVGQKLAELVTKKSVLNDINTILEAAAPIITKIGDFLVGKLGAGLDRAAEGTTHFSDSFDTLKTVFGVIKQVASDVGRIFGALGQAAQTAGGNLSGGLFSGLSMVADLLESQPGQEFLVSMNQFANTLLPALASVLGTVAGALAPVISGIADALSPVISALQPVLEDLITNIGRVLEAFVPILDPLGQLVTTLLPILTPLFQALADVLVELGPFAAAVGESINTFLTPVLALLPGILEKLVTPMVRLAQELFPALTQVLQDNQPALQAAGEKFAQLVASATPLIETITKLAIEAIPYLVPVLSGLVKVILGVIYAVGGFIDILTTAAGAVTAWGNDILGIAQKVAVNFAAHIISGAVNAAAGLASFVSRARSAISNFAVNIVSQAASAMSGFQRSISSGISNAVSYIRGLPGKIRGAMSGAGSILRSVGSAIMSGLISGITSRISDLAGTLRSITNRLPSWKGPEDTDRKILTPAGQLVIEGFMKGIDSRIPELRRQLTNLTAQLPSVAASLSSPAVEMSQDVTPISVTTTPTIRNEVYIDGKQVRVIADQQITRNNQTRDRLAAQGVRR